MIHAMRKTESHSNKEVLQLEYKEASKHPQWNYIFFLWTQVLGLGQDGPVYCADSEIKSFYLYFLIYSSKIRSHLDIWDNCLLFDLT